MSKVRKTLTLRIWFLTLSMLLTIPFTANSALINVDVNAIDNSHGGGGHPAGVALSTGITLALGEAFSVDVNPLAGWGIGTGRLLNADGFYLSDGSQYGIFTESGLAARYGSLAGQIGNGQLFFIGNDFDGSANSAGELALYMWDSYSPNNNGVLTATITYSATSVSEPSSVALLGIAVLGMWIGRRKQKRNGLKECLFRS
jgi:hypothetical protein